MKRKAGKSGTERPAGQQIQIGGILVLKLPQLFLECVRRFRRTAIQFGQLVQIQRDLIDGGRQPLQITRERSRIPRCCRLGRQLPHGTDQIGPPLLVLLLEKCQRFGGSGMSRAIGPSAEHHCNRHDLQQDVPWSGAPKMSHGDCSDRSGGMNCNECRASSASGDPCSEKAYALRVQQPAIAVA